MHVAITDTCIISFETCDHDLIAAFDALHLLASHRSSVALLFYFIHEPAMRGESNFLCDKEINR